MDHPEIRELAALRQEPCPRHGLVRNETCADCLFAMLVEERATLRGLEKELDNERAKLRRYIGPATGDEPVAERDSLLAQITEAEGREEEWHTRAVASARRLREAETSLDNERSTREALDREVRRLLRENEALRDVLA